MFFLTSWKEQLVTGQWRAVATSGLSNTRVMTSSSTPASSTRVRSGRESLKMQGAYFALPQQLRVAVLAR